MNKLDYPDYDDALELINRCILCLKNGGKTEDILFALLKSFHADQVVFLSANNEGVDISNSYVLNADRRYLNLYADHFWRDDPLYVKQFYPDPDNLVFKTDDVIPYSHMVKLEYYNSFLRPQNLLGELIIRLYSKHNVLGAVCLQRFADHDSFCVRDTQKASLIVPHLLNIFETSSRLRKITEELILLEKWLDSHTEGIILLDSQLKPLYLNSKAMIFCSQMNGINKKILVSNENPIITIPKTIIKGCINLTRMINSNASYNNHINKIINTEEKRKYLIQYFPLSIISNEHSSPQFVIFLKELSICGNKFEDILLTEQNLSEREESIARYAAIGLTNKQIADKLYISPFTVQNHLKNIFEKTGLNSRTKLANLVRFSSNPLI